ncbi:MAG: ABC transporter substrate-binding protein [Albidovulum sp.]|nr:ABC transporter substrate-binding protein [Albidovulum sp.]MDE0532262.1 ABC transporter substrate-binding protein [Albidovulum sp.]
MANSLTRRNLFGLLAATAAAVAVPSSAAFSLTENEAKKLVENLISIFKRVGQSEISDEKFIAEFEKALGQFSDIPIIARSALGRPWRNATRQQKIEFTLVFQSHVARKYGKILRKFASNELEIRSARKIKNFVEVSSVVRRAGGQPIDIRWLVSDKSGQTKLFDIILEGVSMVRAERSEIQLMLDKRKGDIDLLITDLGARI